MNIRKLITNNIGLKLISLFLAVITWVYIVGELNKQTPEESAALERLLPYRMTAKYMAVQLNLAGEPKEGYRILTDRATAIPDGVLVVGPRSLLDRVSSIKTEPIDIGEITKPFTKEVSLMPIARGLSVEEKFVTVNIPVENIRE